MEIWNYLLAGIAIGAAAAGIIALIIHQSSKSHVETIELRKKLANLRSEHDAYKKQVRSHFSDTAVLLHSVNESQMALYHTMAKGATELCEPDDGTSPELIGQKMRALTRQTSSHSLSDKNEETDSGASIDLDSRASLTEEAKDSASLSGKPKQNVT